MPLAVVLILLVVGSVLFHILSPWFFTELASNWSMVDMTMNITFYVTGFVFVAVNLFLAYCVIKFRHKKGARAAYEPENKKLEYWLTGITAVGVALMLTPGLFVWAKFVDVPADAHVVEAVGQQWHWTFRYPGADGKMGETDAERISMANPFGLDPEDPQFLLRSKDVLHDFAVAQFRVKMDLVPGMTTFMWLTPIRNGRFDLLCEELCGIGHHTMRGAVVVEDQGDFDTWLAQQPTFGELSAKPAGNAATGAAQFTVCAACHGPQGEGNATMNGPKLAGQADWYLKRQIMSYKNGLRGAHEDDAIGRAMIGMVATLTDEAAVDNVVAHIQTLPDNPAASTIEGDVEHGKKLYTVCAYCHGGDGMGRQALNAPRIAGSSDWYLARQLQYFKDGVRGSHPDDFYGFQMGLMGQSLHDDQSVNDIIAYINTL